MGASKTYSTGFESAQFPADGLLGMGFQSISEYDQPPLFQSLIAQGVVDEEAFGFYFADSGSELYLGGSNSDLYSGDFTYVGVSQQVTFHSQTYMRVLRSTDAGMQGYWQTSFDGVFVDGESVVASTAAIIDTGTTQIVGDTDGVKAVYDKIPGSAAASQFGDGIYTSASFLPLPL